MLISCEFLNNIEIFKDFDFDKVIVDEVKLLLTFITCSLSLQKGGGCACFLIFLQFRINKYIISIYFCPRKASITEIPLLPSLLAQSNLLYVFEYMSLM